jgi:ribosomal-protein-alanine N-acetyltransferase
MNEISFSPFPILSTGRLNLRRLTLDDEGEIFAIRSDENIAEYLDRSLYRTIEEAQQFIDKINKEIENNEWIYWAISFKENPKLIGTICLWNFSEDKSIAEIGFELLPSYQGKGIMNEAVVAVIDYGFNSLSLRSIEGEVDPKNIRSIKLMERHGFKLVTEIRENDSQEVKEGKTVVYELIKTR